MAEHVNNKPLFASGGHVWQWEAEAIAPKTLRTVGTTGAARMVLNVGERAAVIAGRGGGPAVLKASGSSRAAADAALSVLEDAITALRRSGQAVPWEDDQGHTGTLLVIDDYRPAGPRVYGQAGGTWFAWQFYTARVLDLAGRS